MCRINFQPFPLWVCEHSKWGRCHRVPRVFPDDCLWFLLGFLIGINFLLWWGRNRACSLKCRDRIRFTFCFCFFCFFAMWFYHGYFETKWDHGQKMTKTQWSFICKNYKTLRVPFLTGNHSMCLRFWDNTPYALWDSHAFVLIFDPFTIHPYLQPVAL